MVYFQTKNPNLGKFWRALEWKMLVYFMTIWNILRQFGITYGRFVKVVVIWYIFPNLVRLDHEKSGNPDREWCRTVIFVALFFNSLQIEKPAPRCLSCLGMNLFRTGLCTHKKNVALKNRPHSLVVSLLSVKTMSWMGV
jgi:hypothetical protein